MYVIKRNGEQAVFDKNKIVSAISKANNEILDEGSIKVNLEDALENIPLEDNQFINKFIEVLQNVLTTYINDREDVKKYGIAYVSNFEITGVVIEDEDKMSITRNDFLTEVHTKMPKLTVVYNKTINYTINEENPVKIEPGNE